MGFTVRRVMVVPIFESVAMSLRGLIATLVNCRWFTYGDGPVVLSGH
jgi:hypothetical protein